MVWDANASNAGFSTANKTWLPVKPPQAARAVSAQGDPSSVLNFYKEMIELRRETPELLSGKIAFLDMPENVLGYSRGDRVICLFNLSKKPVKLDVEGALSPLIAQGADIHGDTVKLAGTGFLIAKRFG